jgi:hypothetical protein
MTLHEYSGEPNVSPREIAGTKAGWQKFFLDIHGNKFDGSGNSESDHFKKGIGIILAVKLAEADQFKLSKATPTSYSQKPTRYRQATITV